MNDRIVSTLITVSGFILSIIVSIIITDVKNRTELIKIHSKFNRQLYSNRLKAYLEISELVSGFLKIIRRNGMSYKQLDNFYEKYSTLDSKSNLLFSYTNISSSGLMDKIKEILDCHKEADDIIDDELIKNLKSKLVYVELTMKYELGVFEYKKPLAVIKKIELPESYQVALDGLYEKQHKRKRWRKK